MESQSSGLKDRLVAEMREALKAGQKVRLSTLRLLSAAVKNREVELRRPVSDEEFVDVVARQVKQRRESAEAFRAGNREDLVAREEEERGVLEEYLPERLSADELASLVEEAVTATGAASPADLGKVMGYVMPRARGRADGAEVQALVRQRLGSDV